MYFPWFIMFQSNLYISRCYYFYAGNLSHVIHGDSGISRLPCLHPTNTGAGYESPQLAACHHFSNVTLCLLRWSVSDTVYCDVGDVQLSGKSSLFKQ